jgi:hypothetical protein
MNGREGDQPCESVFRTMTSTTIWIPGLAFRVSRFYACILEHMFYANL